MNEKILYADDESQYLRLVKLFLEAEKFTVITASNGREALEQLGKHPDTALVILDVMMPEMDGYQTCKMIRSYSDIPVLMLTALGDETHEIKGIKGGADDYLPKPFSRERLSVRVKALLRRVRTEESGTVSAGRVAVNRTAREAAVDGVEVQLTFREFELLYYLMINANNVCSRTQILDRVWGCLYEGDPRTVDTHIKSLRNKLKGAGESIVTFRNAGYSFKEGKE